MHLRSIYSEIKGDAYNLDDYFDAACFAYNALSQKSMGFSPFFLNNIQEASFPIYNAL